jgi:uncharacterized protein YcfJ
MTEKKNNHETKKINFAVLGVAMGTLIGSALGNTAVGFLLGWLLGHTIEERYQKSRVQS